MTTPNPGTNFEMARIKGVADCITKWLDGERVTLGLVLGSGLGGFGQGMSGAREIPYSRLGLPVPNIKGHAGVLRFVPIGPHGVLVFDGRVHLYEGHGVQAVVLGVRAAAMAGAMTQIITCAVGGVDPGLKPGSLVMIGDHINMMGESPLRGVNHDAAGPRFPDMSDPYDKGLRSLGFHTARNTPNLRHINEVVHAAVMGPAYETRAQVRMLRVLGVQTVGMSTVLEVEALVPMGVRVAGIACISNHAAGVTDQPLSHDEVKDVCGKAAPVFSDFLMRFIPEIELPA